jgi:hypothetical protein
MARRHKSASNLGRTPNTASLTTSGWLLAIKWPLPGTTRRSVAARRLRHKCRSADDTIC